MTCGKKLTYQTQDLRDISELLDTSDTLDIVAANGENMPYVGWVKITFSLAYAGAPTTEVIVPTLVMKGNIARPIIGSNVIGLIVNNISKQSNTGREHLVDTVRATFPGQAKAFIEQVTAVVEQVSNGQTSEFVVKTKKERITIPKHMSVKVKCNVSMESPKEDTTLIFEPDVNPRWTERLELSDTLVKVTKGAKPSITLRGRLSSGGGAVVL